MQARALPPSIPLQLSAQAAPAHGTLPSSLQPGATRFLLRAACFGHDSALVTQAVDPSLAHAFEQACLRWGVSIVPGEQGGLALLAREAHVAPDGEAEARLARLVCVTADGVAVAGKVQLWERP